MNTLNANVMQLQRSGIRAYTALARQTPGCAALTIGEPDFDTPQAIKDAANAALAANRTHYAPNQGTDSLRSAIAAFETKRGIACTAEQVLVTVGATGAIYTALTGILSPGDEVIIPTPAFSLYESVTLACGGKPVFLDTAPLGFRLTEEALSAVITPRTRAIILNSPNNPTGAILDEASLAAVKKLLIGKNVWILCDNVYSQLSYAPCPDLSVDSDLKDQILLCQSFSKPYAMTGWRIGYLIGPEETIARLMLLHAAELASVPTFVQAAAEVALTVDPAPMRETYRTRRDYVCARLDEMGLRYPAPEGAFYVFPDISRFGMTSGEFCTRMIREAKVAAVPGSCFGADGHIRLSYCYSDSELKTALDRMAGFLKTL